MGAPCGSEDGGIAEAGVDKLLHCCDAAFAVMVGAVSRNEQANIVVGFKLGRAIEPVAAGAAFLHTTGVIGGRLCEGVIQNGHDVGNTHKKRVFPVLPDFRPKPTADPQIV